MWLFLWNVIFACFQFYSICIFIFLLPKLNTATHNNQTRTRTRNHTHTRTHTRACAQTHAYAHTQIHTHTHKHTRTHFHIQTHTQTHTHTKKHIHTHINSHTNTHTHTRAHTHAHTYSQENSNPLRKDSIPLKKPVPLQHHSSVKRLPVRGFPASHQDPFETKLPAAKDSVKKSGLRCIYSWLQCKKVVHTV